MKRVGAIVVTTDKGLCGGLNTNVLRIVLQQHKEWQGQGHRGRLCRDRQQGAGLPQPAGRATSCRASCSSATARTSTELIGPVKVLFDMYMDGTIDEVHIFFTNFVNTMKQVPRHGVMLPIPRNSCTLDSAEMRKAEAAAGSWDYIYEPDAKLLLDGVLRRYVEAIVYQMVNENMASEQSARMVAMKAASDNAATIIDELQLIYNKSRQAAITKELAEIVGGAAAV